MPTKETGSHTSVSVSPKLRGHFYTLLYTWRPDQIPLEELKIIPRAKRPHKWDEFEKRYGDGHYDDRKHLLDVVLNKLENDKQADLEAVFHILARARHIQSNVRRVWRNLDESRGLLREREIVRTNLKRWISRAIELYRASYAEPVPDETMYCLYTLAEVLRAKPKAKSRRRPRPGHQPEPWLKLTHKRLTRASVPREIRKDLLMAVGLTPYRNL